VGCEGIQALNRKAHYGGLAEGLAEMAGSDRLAGLRVPKQATAELEEAIKPGTPFSVLEDRYCPTRIRNNDHFCHCAIACPGF
jgi:hypothetical protein